MHAASDDGDGGDGSCVVGEGCDVRRSKGRYKLVMVTVNSS